MFSSKSALQFATTIVHLRRQQLTSQVRNRLRPLYERPKKLAARSLPVFNGCRWRPEHDFLPPGPQNTFVADILDGRFSFLNSDNDVGWPPDWNRNDLPKLWLYNLHYLEYLWALNYEDSKSLVLDWIENHTLQQKQLGWESYPTSLRLINLCGVFFSKYRRQIQDDVDFLNRLWASIYLQTQWLSEHLETHLLGNHLFENGAALTFVGSCFSGREAERWLQLGKNILEREITEQMLGDGMHFERSPMYHCRITYLLAMLYNTGHSELVDLVKEPLIRTINALIKLTHPDGQIALFNDSAFSVYNVPGELVAYVGEMLVANNGDMRSAAAGPFALPDAGYYGFRDDAGTYIICDAALIGPDYIPGHAHADMFSFELSLKGHPVIVDSGVYDYESSPTRTYCRSTKAHNTVEIEGLDQCEMWAAFRIARRGRPYNVRWKPTQEGFELSAWHDGYKRLKGRPIHHRKFVWRKPGSLRIEDRIIASCPKSVTSRLHLHPDCSIDNIEDNSVCVSYLSGKFQLSFSGEGNLSLEESFYCPEFGKKLENKTLAYYAFGDDVKVYCVMEML